ncbi:P-II family nitrogen regulator [Ethanoligenens harbinense]|uniref:Nitrogen regulatory protein P-II n=1 Tax=Ethanoligenens harbinense (strain DSM 18485 / JCM 12961 / CGMCC 1.5033 / YUAN-3) TaxID=663278 RepID=E6U3Y3_ETHHY|nr:P-II family nitrogen regulator [Ethanoligenens harbinense]ADU27663.1 nitrogen regulatory protein P-II [Ethanoligenens harbinense YUAN-3]AVQ96700.1 P-II family nitrogen regulator [Ethanoligenens harbinense YUAN-3]AYF39360.1 P-II family nitrogen regulator [Ethanoligenens harbinense]AYF42185.1 P-II family nitrogen regulator [Ethanoligenens harbinense]QCN92940.1 P-II family nitrogen regulator [Ethanoligenens harbinense]
MKKVEAIIRPEKLDDVKAALNALDIKGVTVTQVSGAGNQKGQKNYYRGAVVELALLPKVKIEIVAEDDRVSAITGAVAKAAKTGAIGDGKIFVTNVEEVIRIRTGDTGDGAI